jgi:hypothetical protein
MACPIFFFDSRQPDLSLDCPISGLADLILLRANSLPPTVPYIIPSQALNSKGHTAILLFWEASSYGLT